MIFGTVTFTLVFFAANAAADAATRPKAAHNRWCTQQQQKV